MTYGITSPVWEQHPAAKARAFGLVDAFSAAGFILQCDEDGWSVRIEGEFMGETCTLYDVGDTEERDIERYVWDGVGSVSSIVAEYVRGADNSGY